MRPERERRGQKAMGVHALAVELGCSDSTVYSLMRTAREEDGSSEGWRHSSYAIVSRIGRRIVFDVERARELATKGGTIGRRVTKKVLID